MILNKAVALKRLAALTSRIRFINKYGIKAYVKEIEEFEIELEKIEKEIEIIIDNHMSNEIYRYNCENGKRWDKAV